MVLNFLNAIFRNFIKRKTYSVNDIAGMAIGIASFLFIMMYVRDELKNDRYHDRAEDNYRVCMVYDFGGVGENSAGEDPVSKIMKFVDRYPSSFQARLRDPAQQQFRLCGGFAP